MKATKEGDARPTPLQAATAASESGRYVLCVVDLRDVPFERLNGGWTAADVEPLAKVLTGLGNHGLYFAEFGFPENVTTA